MKHRLPDWKMCSCCLLLAGLALAPAGCAKKAPPAAKNKVVRVTLAKMPQMDFRQRIPVQGTVEPVEFASLSSRTEGTLDILNVDEGDVVKKGQLLFQIDRQNLENEVSVAQRALEVCKSEVNTARISLQLAQIKLKKAEIDYERAKTLRKSNAVSQDNYEAAELAAKEAQAECAKSQSLLRIAEALEAKQETSLSIARKNLADSEIKAPFDGIITEKFVERGEFVKGGTQIIRLENQKSLEVVCQISALHYNSILPGKTRAVFALDDMPAGEAIVSYRSPSVDPLSRTFKIKILLPADTSLVSGLMCSVDLLTRESKGYGLPSDAIQIRGDNVQVAFADKDGIAEQLEIKTGIVDGKFTEVLNAKDFAGRRFVVSGQTFINPGDKLSVLRELDSNVLK
ncbi:MAG: efflux RND transporter periplasmic adaptor subunit [Lentisphaeria bacterium]|nr:efflux RND transporter periplasmic adaptor subunit [Lentisphaeria bacterium]